MADRGIARVGDLCHGICTNHQNPIEVNGRIVTGSPDCFINNKAIARIGDLVQGDCGHYGTIITGSPDAYFNGIGHARLNDQFQGDYTGTIIQASEDSY